MIKKIESVILEFYEIDHKLLVSKSREKKLVEARTMGFILCLQNGITSEVIGRYFNRNHSTVTINANKYLSYMDYDTVLRSKFTAIKSKLYCDHEFEFYESGKKVVKICTKCDYMERIIL